MATTSLFHFTRTFDTLSKIICQKSFWPQFCLEDASWITGETKTQVAFCITSFCDIPLSRLDEHVSIFGKYGIALSKEWGLRSGLNPVLYINKKSPMINGLRDSFDKADHVYEALGAEAYIPAVTLAGYCKPYQGVVHRKGLEIQKVFYDEQEWRYIPRNIHGNFSLYDTIENPKKERLEQLNQETKKYSLKFAADDVKYVVVDTSADACSIIETIEKAFAKAPAQTVSRLLTRIVTLTDVKSDF